MSRSFIEEVLTVTWQIPDPPLPARQWHSWEENLGCDPQLLETRLSWPAGTLEVLERAFRQQLPRATGWDLSKLSKPLAYQKAARVFRRGVATDAAAPQLLNGQYFIRLRDQWDWPSFLPEGGLAFIDQHVMNAWKILPQDFLFPVAVDESSKSLDTVAQLIALAQDAQSRGAKGPWTIIGGGILADAAAFAAALCGQEFRLVPTTLLAMLDACVGGKTGVNFPPFGKNQIGLFAFPSEVSISTAWLSTLPQRERLAGLCEGFKHALLLGDPALARTVAQLDLHFEELPRHLRRLVELKVEVVMKDPSEQGLRATLNLGHTLAHALERVSHQRRQAHPILHGEAVGVGLLFCLDLSHHLGYLPAARWQAMRQLLLESRLLLKPKQLLKYLGYGDLASNELIEELLIGIKQDKKIRSADGSEWILLKDWGEVVQHRERYTVSIFDDDFRTIYRKFVTNWQN